MFVSPFVSLLFHCKERERYTRSMNMSKECWNALSTFSHQETFIFTRQAILSSDYHSILSLLLPIYLFDWIFFPMKQKRERKKWDNNHETRLRLRILLSSIPSSSYHYHHHFMFISSSYSLCP